VPTEPPPLPPPPGPASAAGRIVRSKIAAVAMPLIRRALAGVAVFSVAFVGEGRWRGCVL
jgi:hypothetical protein